MTSTTASTIAPKIDKVIFNMTGYKFKDLIAWSIQDCEALNVATELDLNEEKCTMYQGDKIGRSAIGELVRTRMKVPINPSDEGVDLMTKLRNQVKFLTLTNSNRSAFEKFLGIHTDLPNKILKLDLNGTHVNAVYELVKSSLFLEKSLLLFFFDNNISEYLESSDWEFCQEVEGILRLQNHLTIHSQNETKLNGAYGLFDATNTGMLLLLFYCFSNKNIVS